ncbi:helix-turn-helix domain-containing protein [Pseudarthrobacter siccitolerans]
MRKTCVVYSYELGSSGSHYLLTHPGGTRLNTNHYSENRATESASSRAATEIRGLMGARRLTAADLAQALNISYSTAAKRMKGEGDITLDEIEAIAAWLDVPVTRLIAPAEGALYAQ